jgi:hypothetical protein
MGGKAEEFRKNAKECSRLATLLKNPEHKLLAAEYATAWLVLAQYAERPRAAEQADPQTVAEDEQRDTTRRTRLGAVGEVIRKCPENTHREADEFAGHIIRHLSLYSEWFWKRGVACRPLSHDPRSP